VERTKALNKINHPPPKRRQNTPFVLTLIHYGAKVQETITDDTPPLDIAEITKIQCITGICLFYTCMIDSTIVVAVNDIGQQQSTGTQLTKIRSSILMDYLSVLKG